MSFFVRNTYFDYITYKNKIIFTIVFFIIFANIINGKINSK